MGFSPCPAAPAPFRAPKLTAEFSNPRRIPFAPSHRSSDGSPPPTFTWSKRWLPSKAATSPAKPIPLDPQFRKRAKRDEFWLINRLPVARAPIRMLRYASPPATMEVRLTSSVARSTKVETSVSTSCCLSLNAAGSELGKPTRERSDSDIRVPHLKIGDQTLFSAKNQKGFP